jgi:hypothetical protein
MNVAGNWTNNGTFTHNSGTVVFNGTSEQIIGGSAATSFNNLTVNSDATAAMPASTVPTVESTLTNNGALEQAQTVSGSGSGVEFLHITNSGGSADKYLGVVITTTSNFGSTAVVVYGNQACSQPPNIGTGGTLILRCYTITPTYNNLAATVKFWHADSERNTLNLSDINILHEEMSPALWRLQGGRSQGSSGSFNYVQVSTTSYSRFAGGKEGANLVSLAFFTAAPLARGVLLSWQTASELDTAGFNLWRGDAADGPYGKVNEALIPARGGPTWGASYTFTDAPVVAGATYYYKLEEVDVYGQSAFHGPTVVTVGMAQGRSYLPLVGR